MATQPIGERGTEIGSADPEPVWDCIQAAQFLRLHPKTVKRMAQAGKIPGCRLGRRWYFRPSDLDALLRPGISSSLKTNRLRRNSTERRT
jgi:excisionase family DNA binding protein